MKVICSVFDACIAILLIVAVLLGISSPVAGILTAVMAIVLVLYRRSLDARQRFRLLILTMLLFFTVCSIVF